MLNTDEYSKFKRYKERIEVFSFEVALQQALVAFKEEPSMIRCSSGDQ